MAISTTAKAGTATRTRLDRSDPYGVATAALAAATPVTLFSSSIAASKQPRMNDATTAATAPSRSYYVYIPMISSTSRLHQLCPGGYQKKARTSHSLPSLLLHEDTSSSSRSLSSASSLVPSKTTRKTTTTAHLSSSLSSADSATTISSITAAPSWLSVTSLQNTVVADDAMTTDDTNMMMTIITREDEEDANKDGNANEEDEEDDSWGVFVSFK